MSFIVLFIVLVGSRISFTISSVSEGSVVPVWVSPFAASSLINVSRLNEGLWNIRWDLVIQGGGRKGQWECTVPVFPERTSRW